MKLFKFKRKLSKSNNYDTRYILDVLNYEPADQGFSNKFINDSKKSPENEWERVKDLNIDNQNTDVASGYHKACSSAEIAYQNRAFVDKLLSTRNLLSKTVGDLILLCEKLHLFQEDEKTLEENLQVAQEKLGNWRNKKI